MVVADASAVLDALGAGDNPKLVARLSTVRELHAPHLLDLEVLHALRGLVLGKRMSSREANDLREQYSALRIIRYPHHPFEERIWQLRDNLTAYDAVYVALSETLGFPLVTCDASFAAAKVRCEVEVFVPEG